ncbi:MAG: NAD(P)-binding protein [Chloroflexota bacterium]
MSEAPNPRFVGDTKNNTNLPIHPHRYRDAKVATMALKADLAQLEALCDESLNAVIADGQVRYEPLLPYLFLTFADANVHSADSSEMGWFKEVGVSFWVLTHAMKRNETGEYISDHLAWFIPYLFIDSDYGVGAGRESYGLQQEFSRIRPLAFDPENPEFSVDTFAFKSFAPDVEGKIQRLLRVQQLEGSASPAPSDSWESWPDAAFKMITALIEAEPEENLRETLDQAPDPFTALGHSEQRIVFLKQVRDATDRDQASYQAVIEAPLNITTFYGGGSLEHHYRLAVNNLASHPIAQRLGLGKSRVETVAGWRFTLDFDMEAGVEIYRTVSNPQKLAVLGGGLGSLSTVFELTNEVGWQNRYDITVYQLGWRLGGKLSSGRNQAVADRIEEGTGLHFFLGFYNNIFRLVQQCYAELARPSNAPFATWQDAFYQRDFIVIEEFIHNRWEHWQIFVPPNDEIPGHSY